MIEKFFNPWGITLSGTVYFKGEWEADRGYITCQEDEEKGTIVTQTYTSSSGDSSDDSSSGDSSSGDSSGDDSSGEVGNLNALRRFFSFLF